MKKIFTALLICIISSFTLCLAACADGTGGTYYPNNSEMKTNLENAGYEATVTSDLGERNGTRLYATKDSDFIEFYWLDSSDDCEYFYNLLENNHANYNSLVKLENDEKFGNIVYCGTENAVNAAGIKVVKVKV